MLRKRKIYEKCYKNENAYMCKKVVKKYLNLIYK